MLNRSDSTSEEGNSTADADDEKNGEDGGKNMAVLALNPPFVCLQKDRIMIQCDSYRRCYGFL